MLDRQNGVCYIYFKFEVYAQRRTYGTESTGYGQRPVKPLLLQLMIPAVVAQVVNLLYNIVDRIYIGHIEGIGAAA